MNYPICPVCGREFYPVNANQKYCCSRCARTAQARGNQAKIHRSKLKSRIDEHLIYAFHFRCCICGWYLHQKMQGTKFQKQWGCEFHHILPVCEGGENEMDNVVLLCPNCHKEAHAGLIPISELKKHIKTQKDIDEAWMLYQEFTGFGEAMDELMIDKGNFRAKWENGQFAD